MRDACNNARYKVLPPVVRIPAILPTLLFCTLLPCRGCNRKRSRYQSSTILGGWSHHLHLDWQVIDECHGLEKAASSQKRHSLNMAGLLLIHIAQWRCAVQSPFWIGVQAGPRWHSGSRSFVVGQHQSMTACTQEPGSQLLCM